MCGIGLLVVLESLVSRILGSFLEFFIYVLEVMGGFLSKLSFVVIFLYSAGLTFWGIF